MTFDPTDPAQAEQLDTLTVAGQAMPGLVDFPKPGDSPRTWDVRKGVGLSGATIVFTGLDVAKWTTRLTMWLPAHFALWKQVKGLVAPPPQGQRPSIIDVYHPCLEEVGLRAAGVENRTMFMPISEDGDWFIDIMWVGYRKPLPQIGTGSGAKATQYQQTANDAGSAQIAALMKQLAALDKK